MTQFMQNVQQKKSMQQTKQILNVIFVLCNRYTMIKRAKHNITPSCPHISYSISWEQTFEGVFWHYELS